MKLLRLKITDPKGFRSLPCGFEHHFRTEWSLQEEQANHEDFAPFVCAGPNGSGKSNLLEALAAIFYHMECLYSNLPDSFTYDEEQNPNGFQGSTAIPDGFEVEYLIKPIDAFEVTGYNGMARVCIKKIPKESPQWWLLNPVDSEHATELRLPRADARRLLPDFVLGYSSGENEILSLPFFKIRFIQLDEYWNALARQLPYSGAPETRLAYLDNSFSQAIVLCNLLFQDDDTLQPFREDVGIEALTEFRIILRRRIELAPEELERFDRTSNEERIQRANKIRSKHPQATEIERVGLIRREIVESNRPFLSVDEDYSYGPCYQLNLLHLLEGDKNSSHAVNALKRCATLHYENGDTLILDYWVNEATKQAFRDNFTHDPLALFQAFQVLLTLNLYTVSETLKADLYQSDSEYVSETIPTLASDECIMRFKFVRFRKSGITEPVMLKNLSDGEHQLLHSLGLCLLFRNTNSLFLLDEPETHFNPQWRANFISCLRQCFPKEKEKGEKENTISQEMLITTHTPFLISDSKAEKVLVFHKDKHSREVSISRPKYNTLGASINLITMEIFKKQETIGAYAKSLLQDFLSSEFADKDPHELAQKIINTMGDSIERSFAVQEVLARKKNTIASKKDD